MASRRWLGIAALAAVASCNLIGGTDGLFILEPPSGDGGSNQGAGGEAGMGGRPQAPASSTGVGGGSVECGIDADCDGTSTDCQDLVCSNHVCGFDPVPTNTSCDEDGGLYCNGAGNCVECTTAQHCMSNVCVDGACYAATCDDRVLNGSESAIDCGGSCSPCENGLACGAPDHCKSKICSGGICVACTAQADCASQDYCDLGPGYCTPKKDVFEGCGNGYECTTGTCCLGSCFWC
jgi:hypothetical protein